jgi:hypothetical protein
MHWIIFTFYTFTLLFIYVYVILFLTFIYIYFNFTFYIFYIFIYLQSFFFYKASSQICCIQHSDILNKNSPWVHTKLELDVLGVVKKLVKYVVHLSKRKSWKKDYFSSHRLPKHQKTNFWSQGILGVKLENPFNCWLH